MPLFRQGYCSVLMQPVVQMDFLHCISNVMQQQHNVRKTSVDQNMKANICVDCDVYSLQKVSSFYNYVLYCSEIKVGKRSVM